jgi:FKBP-type peptidyl-prolyl cis-trans isomerase SlpA
MTTSDNTHLAVALDSYLTLHYRIGLPEGGNLVNTFEDKPATLLMSTGQFSPSLEQTLIGMTVGERKTNVLEPEMAFGVKNPDLVRRLSRKTLAENSQEGEEYVPGDMIEFNAPNGATYSGMVLAVEDDDIVFDFNHPLAGKTIEFEVEIIGIL